MKKLLILLFLSISCSNLIGQDTWTHFNPANTGDNGILGNYIYCFLTDSNNTLWMGTSSGINLYDGKTWQTMTTLDGLTNNSIRNFALDSNNNIWISYEGYNSGVSMYDGNNFTHFSPFNEFVEDIFVDNAGNIWFTTGYIWFTTELIISGGLYKYDGNSWTSYTREKGLPDNYRISCITQDKNGDMWIGTEGAGTYLLKNDTIIPFCWEDNSTEYIDDIHVDNSGNVWVAALKVHKYNVSWITVDPFEPNQICSVRDINEDEKGRILFSTTCGFSILDGSTFTNYTIEDNLPHKNLLTSHVKNDSIWIGTEDGAALLVDNVLTEYSTNDNGLISDWVNFVFEDDSANLWFCTPLGISKYNGSTWRNYKHTGNGKEIKWVSFGMQDRDGNLWFSATGGIFKYNHSTWEVFDYTVDDIFNNSIKDILHDNDGNFWFAGWKYLLKYDGTNWIQYNDTSGFQSRYIEALHQDSKGRIWIGSRSGISLYDGNGFSHFINGVNFNVTTPIYSIFEDKTGQIYAVSESNILTYQNEGWEKLPFSNSHFNNGICDNSNQIWLSTDEEGVIKYNSDHPEFFNISNGLNTNRVNSLYRTKEGVIYLCTDKGITEIVPKIDVNNPEITILDSINNIHNLKLESSGITKPYWFSIDGEEFMQNDGIFDSIQNPPTIYITNIYDTIQVNYCLNRYNKTVITQCDQYTSPSGRYIWETSGTYYDTIPSSTGCDSILVIEFQLEGCAMFSKKSEFNDLCIYPNPTTGKTEIILARTFESLKIKVFNQLGQEIYDNKFNDKNKIELNLSGPNGLYYIEIISGTGLRAVLKVLKN